MNLATLLDPAASLATVIAVLFAAFQIRSAQTQIELSRRATGAQLLLQMDELIRADNHIYRCLVERQSGRQETPCDGFEIRRAMGILERLNILVEADLVDLRLIDDLHGWRFRRLINDESVRGRLDHQPESWRQFIAISEKLQANWAKRERA